MFYRRSFINLIDVDSREIISGWVVVTNVTAPQVLRHYNVTISSGQQLHKKIVFTNPWSRQRRFAIHSSNENIMQSKTRYLDVAANGSAYVKLLFSPRDCNTATKSDTGSLVYLFLNDESGQNEECFSFCVLFSN